LYQGHTYKSYHLSNNNKKPTTPSLIIMMNLLRSISISLICLVAVSIAQNLSYDLDDTLDDAKEKEERRLQQTGETWTLVTNLDYTLSGCSSLCSDAWFGYSVAMPNDGMSVATAGPWKNLDTSSSFDAGQLDVFGGTNYGTIEMEQDGLSGGKWGYYNSALAISGDGLTVAWGSWVHNSADGGVRAYRKSGSSWAIMGGTLGGAGSNDNFGMAVSLSENGDRMVVGAPGKSSNTGRTLVYDWTGTAWQQIGVDINGGSGHLCGKGGTSIDCGGSVM
jgi:hypothetical protein